MGQNYILDRSYASEEATPIPARRVVVAGESDGGAKLPASANAGAILGVTTRTQASASGQVAVRKAGVALVEASGAIDAGAPVNVAGSTGRVKAISEEAGTKINCLGFAETSASEAGDQIEVFLSIHQREA